MTKRRETDFVMRGIKVEAKTAKGMWLKGLKRERELSQYTCIINISVFLFRDFVMILS